jgi:polar amino acid transport system substrate-binding protein
MSAAMAKRVLATVLTLAGLSACASVDVPESLPGPTTTTTEAPTATEQPDCGDPLASLRPDGPASPDVPAGSYMDEISGRRLRVGVDVATRQLSAVDPLTGQVEGFDADIAREVALALYGGPRDQIDDHIQFVGIPSSDRITALTEGRVDLVASAFTINCARREEIEFSSEYFHAGQRVLVRTDGPESIEELGEDGGTVCVSAGSTAIDNINAVPEPRPTIEPAPQRADCLVRLQQGVTDAMATDDAILAGMAAQDPNLRVVGEQFSEEPYGLGLPPDQPDWVRYVNAVLEDVRSSGRWDELYDLWLGPRLGPSGGPPVPVYED